MTWAEFVKRVEEQLLAKGLTRDVLVNAIDWDKAGFGGPIPDVYVNYIEGEITVTED